MPVGERAPFFLGGVGGGFSQGVGYGFVDLNGTFARPYFQGGGVGPAFAEEVVLSDFDAVTA